MLDHLAFDVTVSPTRVGPLIERRAEKSYAGVPSTPPEPSAKGIDKRAGKLLCVLP
jgi:hypothetical protein